MIRKSFMFVAGEPSGDLLAAELVPWIREKTVRWEAAPTGDYQPLHASLVPEFYGAGGAQMAEAGVQIECDMTHYAVVGFWEVLKRYGDFLRLFHRLTRLAIQRGPAVIICVDFSGFNLRFVRAIRKHARALEGTFGNWSPRIVQYVSPQVWASRPERARQLGRDVDLLLSILPFEKEWYARHVPELRVEFVGHPLIDRHRTDGSPIAAGMKAVAEPPGGAPNLVLLPGSRMGELRRHLPAMMDAWGRIRAAGTDVRGVLVLANEDLVQVARRFQIPPEVQVQSGGLSAALGRADVAIAATGTVTLECAYFGVPTVALYKTSALTYAVAKRLVNVKFLAMPNLLAGEAVFPEFVQEAATGENLSRGVLELLNNPERRRQIRLKLAEIVRALGTPGASVRAAEAIVDLAVSKPTPLRAWLGTR